MASHCIESRCQRGYATHHSNCLRARARSAPWDGAHRLRATTEHNCPSNERTTHTPVRAKTMNKTKKKRRRSYALWWAVVEHALGQVASVHELKVVRGQRPGLHHCDGGVVQAQRPKLRRVRVQPRVRARERRLPTVQSSVHVVFSGGRRSLPVLVVVVVWQGMRRCAVVVPSCCCVCHVRIIRWSQQVCRCRIP